MYLTDYEVVEWFCDSGIATPRDIAEGRRRENVLRIQCRNLSKIGLLLRVAHDTFKISDAGRAHLHGDLSYPSIGGQFDLEAIMNYPVWSLSDFSELDSQDLKIINEGFFEDGDSEYRLIDGSSSRTLQKIRNVKDYRLGRIIEEFPRMEPLPQQCAHWMRAFSGLHMFPDANHRTGMAALYGLLDNNDFAPPLAEWPDESIDRTVLQSKIIRGLHSDVRFNTLWMRDELYATWHRYFRNFLCGVCNQMPLEPSVDDLRRIIEFGRENDI